MQNHYYTQTILHCRCSCKVVINNKNSVKNTISFIVRNVCPCLLAKSEKDRQGGAGSHFHLSKYTVTSLWLLSINLSELDAVCKAFKISLRYKRKNENTVWIIGLPPPLLIPDFLPKKQYKTNKKHQITMEMWSQTEWSGFIIKIVIYSLFAGLRFVVFFHPLGLFYWTTVKTNLSFSILARICCLKSSFGWSKSINVFFHIINLKYSEPQTSVFVFYWVEAGIAFWQI